MEYFRAISTYGLVFLLIILFAEHAEAQLDTCSFKGTEAECATVTGCQWCSVEVSCKSDTIPCIECVDYDVTNCSDGVGCYWCPNKNSCLADEVSCTCGDGFLQLALNEECDSGPNCLEDCTCLEGYISDGWGGCGYGCNIGSEFFIPAGETRLDVNICQVCDPEVSTTSWTTVPCVCGDGLVTGDEECDDGGTSPSCDEDCTLAVCGDGLVNVASGEECDDGGVSATCDEDCTLPVCGDGLVNIASGEDCENSTDVNCVDCVCVNNSIPGPAKSCCPDCLIDNSCITAGEVDPYDKCQSCNPEVLQTDWSDNGKCFSLPLFIIPSITSQTQ